MASGAQMRGRSLRVGFRGLNHWFSIFFLTVSHSRNYILHHKPVCIYV